VSDDAAPPVLPKFGRSCVISGRLGILRLIVVTRGLALFVGNKKMDLSK
jgi:hypothetical protein